MTSSSGSHTRPKLDRLFEDAFQIAASTVSERAFARAWEERKRRALESMIREHEAFRIAHNEEYEGPLQQLKLGLDLGRLQSSQALVLELQKITSRKLEQLRLAQREELVVKAQELQRQMSTIAEVRVKTRRREKEEERQGSLSMLRIKLLRESEEAKESLSHSLREASWRQEGEVRRMTVPTEALYSLANDEERCTHEGVWQAEDIKLRHILARLSCIPSVQSMSSEGPYRGKADIPDGTVDRLSFLMELESRLTTALSQLGERRRD